MLYHGAIRNGAVLEHHGDAGTDVEAILCSVRLLDVLHNGTGNNPHGLALRNRPSPLPPDSRPARCTSCTKEPGSQSSPTCTVDQNQKHLPNGQAPQDCTSHSLTAPCAFKEQGVLMLAPSHLRILDDNVLADASVLVNDGVSAGPTGHERNNAGRAMKQGRGPNAPGNGGQGSLPPALCLLALR